MIITGQIKGKHLKREYKLLNLLYRHHGEKFCASEKENSVMRVRSGLHVCEVREEATPGLQMYWFHL